MLLQEEQEVDFFITSYHHHNLPFQNTKMSIDEMQIDSEVAAGSKPRLPVTVNKPIPYTFDLGNLLCNDTNPLPAVSQLQEL